MTDVDPDQTQSRREIPPHEIAREKARSWLEENRAAIDAWNDYVEEHGVPLAEFRQF